MRARWLTQQAAAKRMGIPQPKVSGMMHGDFTNLSERKLMDCLNRLGYDIEIRVVGIRASRASDARHRLTARAYAPRCPETAHICLPWLFMTRR